MYSNTITIVRTLFVIPIFLILAFGEGENRWWALGLFLGAGVLDIVDGKVARAFGEVSKFGAMLDMMGDRLLTLAAAAGLIAAGTWDNAGGPLAVAASASAFVLIARCMIVAGLKEPLGGKLDLRVDPPEWAKIALAFTGMGLLMMPTLFADQIAIANWCMVGAGILTIVIVAGYWLRALKLFAELEAAGAG